MTDEASFVSYREHVKTERALADRISELEKEHAVFRQLLTQMAELPKLLREMQAELATVRRLSEQRPHVEAGLGVAIHDMTQTVRDSLDKHSPGRYGALKDGLAYIGFAAAALLALKVFGLNWMTG